MKHKTIFYFAPLEGITGYTFRNVHHQYYAGMDKYFSPFLSPNQHHAINPKEKRDILQEHNKGISLVPQILTNKAELMLVAAKELKQIYGYEEVNLNLGCPSKTVVSKGKGAGCLADTEKLERFLEEIFTTISVSEQDFPQISIKTRIGMDDAQEFTELLRIYNQYPLSELIIHPRVQKDFYKNTPNLEVFAQAVQHSNNSLCYNGDICTLEDFLRIKETFPTVEKIMIGRGLLVNPALVGELQAYEQCVEKGEQWTGYKIDFQRLKQYHDRLFEKYIEQMSGDTNVLFKMKELWVYLGRMFPEQERQIKKIKKANKLAEYEKVTKEFWELLV